MPHNANGLHFACPNKEVHHHRTNDTFVDDVTRYTNRFVRELEGEYVQHTVAELMQQDASLWNELLHISGGKLALHKCLYYILAWQWRNGQATLKPTSEIQPKISLDDGQQSTPIRHLEHTKRCVSLAYPTAWELPIYPMPTSTPSNDPSLITFYHYSDTTDTYHVPSSLEALNLVA